MKIIMKAKVKAVWNGDGWDCVVKTYDKSPNAVPKGKCRFRRKARVNNLRLCDELVIPMALLEHNGYDIGIICDELELKAE